MPKIKDTTHKNKKKSKYSKHKQEVNKEYAMLDEQGIKEDIFFMFKIFLKFIQTYILGNELFDVEFIFGKKIDPISQEIKYLVKWKGFKQSDSTWEPLANLITVYSTVRDYDLKQSRALFNLKYLKSPIERENEIFLKTGVDQIGNTQSFANIIQEDLEKQFKSNENEDNLKTSKNNKNKKEQNKLNNEKVINKEIIDMNKESKVI